MVLFLLELLIYTENYSVFTEMIFGLKPFKRIRIYIYPIKILIIII